MMLVPCYVAPSAIAGLGAFAAEPIPQGTLVWQHVPGIDLDISIDQLKTHHPEVQAFIRKYGHLDPQQPEQVYLCTGHGRFINHANPANTEDRGDGIYAVRDIAAGEEITGNYQEYDPRYAENWELDI